jgi:hypothetical protein
MIDERPMNTEKRAITAYSANKSVSSLDPRLDSLEGWVRLNVPEQSTAIFLTKEWSPGKGNGGRGLLSRQGR